MIFIEVLQISEEIAKNSDYIKQSLAGCPYVLPKVKSDVLMTLFKLQQSMDISEQELYVLQHIICFINQKNKPIESLI